MNASTILIPIETDVLIRLLKLREHRSESYSDVLRRVLPRTRKAAPPAPEPTKDRPSIDPSRIQNSSNGVEYEFLGERYMAADYGEAMVAILGRLSCDYVESAGSAAGPSKVEPATILPGLLRRSILNGLTC